MAAPLWGRFMRAAGARGDGEGRAGGEAEREEERTDSGGRGSGLTRVWLLV